MEKSRNFLMGSMGLATVIGVFLLGTQHPASSTTGAPVPVQIANTLPIHTSDAGLLPKQPFQTTIVVNIANGASGGGDNGNVSPGTQTFKVPDGKRLVIETASMNRSGAIQSSTTQIFFDVPVNGGYSYYALPACPGSTASYAGTTQAMKIYADPSGVCLANAFRNGTVGAETDTVSISGYLEDAP